MKPTLQVRLSQHLALTPQLQQSIRLLQLSTLELHQEVEQMLEQNPFLEAEEDHPTYERAAAEPAATAGSSASPEDSWDSSRAEETSTHEGASEPAVDQLDFNSSDSTPSDDWEGGVDRDDFEGARETGTRNGASDEEDSDWSERSSVSPSLQDHLRTQLLGLHLPPEDALLVDVLIDSLNEDGYLADSLETVAERLAQVLEQGTFAQSVLAEAEPAAGVEMASGSGATAASDAALPASANGAALTGVDSPLAEEASPEEVLAAALREELVDRLRCALHWLHHLEPTGVGARSLSECLVLQLREKDESEARDVAIRICQGHLELLARRDMRKLTAATSASEELIRAAQSLIVTLEPKPGRRFSRAESNIVVPDVIVQKSGRGWKVVLNPDVMPRLRINDMYAQVLRQHRSPRGSGGEDGGVTLSARLQEARWFVKNIMQRFDTIQRVSAAIVERQKNFFTHGEIAMKPLVLREIADELGLHESTISRVTTAKYMSTPFGTFELKYFFGSSLNTDAGGNASSTAVRALIKQFVAAEDPRKPLSDSQISDMLEEQGIQVARRTVAKYREALKIAPANLRKDI